MKLKIWFVLLSFSLLASLESLVSSLGLQFALVLRP